MEPWLSWTAVGIIAAGGYIYYSGTKLQDLVRTLQGSAVVQKPAQELQAARRKSGATKPVQSKAAAPQTQAPVESTGKQPVLKRRKAPAAQSAPPGEPPTRQNDGPDEDDGDDKEWARQLTAAKKGISLNKAGPEAGNKAVASGGKADKKQTPNGKSAASGAQETQAKVRGAGDVSDMLPAAAAGPSTLRITGEQKAKKQNAPRVEPAKETKKQRQNRRKVEEQKVQREEDEKRRQAQLEQQRRSAREARGEPAKNGMPAAKPQTSVWTSSAQAGSAPGTSGPATAPILANNPTQLLDTFEQDANSTTSSNEEHTNVTTPATVASTSYEQELPSEEVQLAMLTEDTKWNEVSSKKKKTKAKAPAPVSPRGTSPKRTDNYAAIASTEASKPKPKAPEPKVQPAPVTAPVPKTNGYAVLEQMRHPDDSEWAA